MGRNPGFLASSPGFGPSEAEVAELGRLRRRFRRHRIFRHVTPERGVRYLAWAMVLGVRPHTIITDDLAELSGELERSAPHELGAGLLRYFARRTPGPAAGFAVQAKSCVRVQRLRCGGLLRQMGVGVSGLGPRSLAGRRLPVREHLPGGNHPGHRGLVVPGWMVAAVRNPCNRGVQSTGQTFGQPGH